MSLFRTNRNKQSILKSNLIYKLFIVLSFINICYYIVNHLDNFTVKYDHQKIGKIYSQSQYILGPKAQRNIGDDGLYAFAGYYYLMEKGDVSKVNFENPPLGKYLIGVSILLFKNPKVISIIYGLTLLTAVYFYSTKFFNKFIGSLAVFLLSFSPLFLDQLTNGLLDLPLTLFFCLGLFFYFNAHNKLLYYYISSAFFGCAVATKFFPALIFVIMILGFHTFFTNKHTFRNYLTSLVIIPIVYIMSHFFYFFYHPSLGEFIKYQRWIISWRRGNPYLIGNIINVLFWKKYFSWWDQNLSIRYGSWTFLSPLLPVLSFVSIYCKSKNIKKINVFLLWSVAIIYFIYVLFNTTGLEKYLLPIYPILAILSSYTLHQLFSIIINNGRFRYRAN